MQFRRPERRRHGGYFSIEVCFGFGHQFSKTFYIAAGHIFNSSVHNVYIVFAQCFVLCSFGIAVREWVCFVQVRQNLDGILLGTQVSKHPVQWFLNVQGAYFNLITIKCHQVWLNTECTSLVETSATTAGT